MGSGRPGAWLGGWKAGWEAGWEAGWDAGWEAAGLAICEDFGRKMRGFGGGPAIEVNLE